MGVVRAILVLSLAACGHASSQAPGETGPNVPPPFAPDGAPRAALDGAGALNAFQRAWDLEVLPNLTDRQREVAANWTADVHGDHVQATLVDCHLAAARIVSTLGSGPHALEPVIAGQVEALDHPGECWQLDVTRAMSLMEGFLDPSTTQLLLVWIAPEG